MATYYVTQAASGGGDGSSGDPWTLAEAQAGVSDGDKVWVKADNDYTTEDGANDCILYITDAGVAGSPIVWEGYHTNTGDGGIVTLDANDTLANAARTNSLVSTYNVFKNFRFTAATGDGFAGGSDDLMTFQNCRFDNNGGHGCGCDNYCSFINCSFDNNTSMGLTFDLHGTAISCVVYSNGGRGVDMQNGIFAYILCYANGSSNQNLYAIGAVTAFINCTIDGDDALGGRTPLGIEYTSATLPASVVNCILHDCNIGIQGSASLGNDMCISRNNLFNSNDTDANSANWPAVSTGNGVGDQGDVAATPGFTNEASDDYSLTGSGSADAAGIDAKFTDDFWDSFNGATNPPSP
jgi:hypothetical protein